MNPSTLSPRNAAFVATFLAVVFLLTSMLTNTGGRIVLPLDDSYIYLQYAHQNAHGEIFRYNDGDPATTGATSLLHALLLTPFAIVVDGDALAGIAFALGGLFFLLTLRSAAALAGEWIGPDARLPTVVLVALSGPFLWGAFSGMEIALVAFLTCQAVRAAANLNDAPDDRASRRAFMVWGALFAISRPEAAVLITGIVIVIAFVRRSPSAVGWPTLAVPVAASTVPFLMNILLTGHPGSTALASKAAPYLPGTTLTTWVMTATEFFLRSLKGLFDSGDTAFAGWPNAYTSLVTFAAPLTLFFAVIGVFPRATRELSRRAPGAGVTSLFLVGGALVIWSALVPINLHWSRYAIPYTPLIAVWVLAGIWSVADRLGTTGDTTVRTGLISFFVIVGAVGALFFTAAYGWNAREIRDQHIAMAEWIEEKVPANTPLATNDVGALRFYGSGDVIDLHGITTRHFAAAKQLGTGSIYEALERIPLLERPRYLALIPHWYDPELFKILQPVRIQTLNQASISGSPLALYRADWTAVGTADAPMQRTLAAVQGKRLVDRIDVADLESERSHGYSADIRPASHASPLGVFRDPDTSKPLVDGARRITGRERFDLSVSADRAAVLVARAIGPLRAQVVLPDGSTVPLQADPAEGSDSWTEVALPLSRALLTGPTLHVEVIARDGGVQEGGYLPAHYWLYQ